MLCGTDGSKDICRGLNNINTNINNSARIYSDQEADF